MLSTLDYCSFHIHSLHNIMIKMWYRYPLGAALVFSVLNLGVCLETCSPMSYNESDFDTDIYMSSEPVHDEYIVRFQAYYTREARYGFVAASMRSSKHWDVVPRHNPAFHYPSDFELLHIYHNVNSSLERLERHPLILTVTPNMRVKRHLKQMPSSTLNEDPLRSPSFWDAITWKSRGLKRSMPRQITSVLEAESIWRMGYSGQGIKVAIFDTGLAEDHPHFKRGRIKDRTNWTDEKSKSDSLGHGTFVAGIISSYKECLGFAPDADIHIFRVFTYQQVSYTSWFLDAFNYAILKKIDVLNLSIGGPDFLDHPFVDKVWELTANGVILVSAIGNDGPLYGTLNNPADQMDTIGVGGINYDDQIAKFSSRGMTAWELPYGYGRVKPDIVTYGNSVRGSSVRGGCRTLSGTSVASPVIAGAITLLYSAVKDKGVDVNPASMKQALTASATRIADANMFEQGAGKINLKKAYTALLNYKPQVTLFPPYIDATECPYMWPFCSQPLYYTGMPLIANITILNGMSLSGRVRGSPIWQPYTPQFGSHIDVAFTWSHTLWPWSGWLSVYVSVRDTAANLEGVAQGQVTLIIESPPSTADGEIQVSEVKLPLRIKVKGDRTVFSCAICVIYDFLCAMMLFRSRTISENGMRIIPDVVNNDLQDLTKVIPTPPKQRRLLWDQFHNLRYPPGYFPRDNLKMKSDPLDWHGDHIHTNFKDLYTHLRQRGFYIEILGVPYTCFDAANYGTLLIVDSEEEFFLEEIDKLTNDVANGLSLIVFADWYNTSVMEKIKFYDENTRQWWMPDTGGANIPALNDLLSAFNMSLGDEVFEGDYKIDKHEMHYASGSSITKFPGPGLIITETLNNQGVEVLDGVITQAKDVPILGLYENRSQPIAGRIVLYGDSNCIDSSHMKKECFWLLDALLEFTMHGQVAPMLDERSRAFASLSRENLKLLDNPDPPERLKTSRLIKYSKVLDSQGRKPIPHCPNYSWAIASPLNITSQGSIFKHLELLSLHAEENPFNDEDIPPAGRDDGMPWDWSARQHDHDSDPTTFFGALAVVTVLIVLIFFINFIYKTRRRPPRRRTRLKGIHRITNSLAGGLSFNNSKQGGV